jgi:NADH-quinone oxidoreductase subunit H
MDPINWIQTHIPAWVFITVVVHLVILGSVAYLILLERKIASWVQDRIGPNRVGLGFGIIPGLKDFHFWGLGQPLADGIKFILKEDYRAKSTDMVLFTLAPLVMIIVIIISIATVPWGGTKQSTANVEVAKSLKVENNPRFVEQAAIAGTPENLQVIEQAKSDLPPGDQVVSTGAVQVTGNPDGTYSIEVPVTYRYGFQVANLNVGVLFILAVLSLAVYGVVIGGWASNNKYSFLGGLRATANMISYEIPLGLAVLCIVLMFGTLDMGEMVNRQAHYWHLGGIPIPAWNVFSQPFTFILFLICIHAEANRAPFDMAEAEQELVGGYHTEYSAMRFALFFLAEYAGMITTSAVCIAMFFGGWHVPGLDRLVVWIVNHAPFVPHDAYVDPLNPTVTNSLAVCIVRSFAFFAKTMLVIVVFMWVRWSLPRFRFDQLMRLAWVGLIPLSLALLMVTAAVIYYYPSPQDGGMISGQQAGMLLAANMAVVVIGMLLGALVPGSYETNKKIRVPGSRYLSTPMAGKLPNKLPVAS